MRLTGLDIANCIILHTNRNYDDVMLTGLKLHKITYYVATEYAKRHNKLLFDCRIEKWLYGATVLSLFHVLKHRTGCYDHISNTLNDFKIIDGDFKLVKFDDSYISDDVLSVVREVTDQLIKKTAKSIVDTMRGEKAWKDNELSILNGNRDMAYTLEELKRATNIEDVGK